METSRWDNDAYLALLTGGRRAGVGPLPADHHDDVPPKYHRPPGDYLDSRTQLEHLVDSAQHDLNRALDFVLDDHGYQPVNRDAARANFVHARAVLDKCLAVLDGRIVIDATAHDLGDLHGPTV